MFKVGDTVVCVNDKGWESFVKGEEYTVTGPLHVMQKLADDLNSGRVTL